ILKPGTANQAIVSFRAVTSILQRICNQSRVTLTDANGNSIFVNSDDTTQQGSQNSTCFFSDGPLPIDDLKWKGNYLNGRDHFQWSMADETFIHSYEVEYSGNGNHFTTIGRQLAQKSYQGMARYSFIFERETLAPVRYYRLKVLSASGNYKYSPIIRINIVSDKITVQPNPFTDKINIRLNLNKMETLQVGLKNLDGISVLAVSRTLPAGTHTIKLEAPVTLPAGIYFLEVIVGGVPVHHVKLIKGM
ncbi:MAG: T9SS type A sorting domain-containing protein, partial [Flavisolibacter sp.]